MDLSVIAQRLAIALGLGLLVGLQRERVQSPLAGIRTFALISIFGSLCALLSETLGGWLVGVGGLTVGAMLVVGNLVQGKARQVEPGITTEIAALAMYALGAYLIVGHTAVAIAVGGGVALLLHWKTPLHEFVAKVGETDVQAIMRFVLVALVIYPVLPGESYGPYHVLNPQQVWLMVVLIVAIGLGGYVAHKLLGQRSGALVAGILGGLISSTATTATYARNTQKTRGGERLAVIVIVTASAIALARVIVEIAVVTPGILRDLAPPLLAMLGWMFLIAFVTYFVAGQKKAEPLEPANPAELRPALVFGGLYALILLGTAAAKDHLGEQGLYGIAAISGLADLDAVTLSTARLVNQEHIGPDLGWRLILAAALSNLVLKGVLAAMLGRQRLFGWMAVPFGAAFMGGAVLLWLWPTVAVR